MSVMNDEDHLMDVTILDRIYKIKCTPDEAPKLQASAQYVDKQMRKLQQGNAVPNADRIAVVTALNISHELLELRQQKNQCIDTMNDRIQNLHDKLKNFLAADEEITV